MSVTIIDSGMEDFERQVKKLHGRVDVGVFGEKNSEMVIIAGANEFGTDRAGKNHDVTIPKRSFLRSTLDEEKENVRKIVDKAKVDIVTGKRNQKTFLNRLGIWFVGKVVNKILAGGEPYVENADSVKAAKIRRGRTKPKPLNDDGHLRDAINHQVKL
ncbi:hypothetical protein DSCW_18200 [Desulfosarcina widdelii]|uniref:Uncharacterized protein n=1 Tax=Desulfosarcina widdelii TaxID=947919 RepID=A0A5K7Z2V7_9BACT|nr:hypothetical protein [Desulfosarcina widdelii]BBO74403.1 hypothetical protein DSCW_18200 [Desulfosarcina widdelii]